MHPPHLPACSYAALQPLHELWRGYASSVLEASSTPEASLLQVDLHGAVLHVARARQASHVGTSGVVLKDSRNAFHIVTESSVTRGECHSPHSCSHMHVL
jgi:ribonuclease P protein subunit POP4